MTLLCFCAASVPPPTHSFYISPPLCGLTYVAALCFYFCRCSSYVRIFNFILLLLFFFFCLLLNAIAYSLHDSSSSFSLSLTLSCFLVLIIETYTPVFCLNTYVYTNIPSFLFTRTAI